MVTKQKYEIANKYKDDNAPWFISVEYLGEINGESLFYFKKKVSGAHMGIPCYALIDNNLEFSRIFDYETLHKATLLHKEFKEKQRNP